MSLPDEWCLYCVGFWVGIAFNLAAAGWLHSILLDGLYMAGLTWFLAEITGFFTAIWFGLSEKSNQ